MERRPLMTMFRQTGTMMQAGVDILRITRVLRAQTEDPEQLALFDRIDHDLRMGFSLADAMAHAPEHFSPVVVSLIREGEARNDLAQAFLQVADFLRQEELQDATGPAPSSGGSAAPRGEAEREVLDQVLQRTQASVLRLLAGFLVAMAVVSWLIAREWIDSRWDTVSMWSAAALVVGSRALWLHLHALHERQVLRCSFCGALNPHLKTGVERGAAICPECTARLADTAGSAPTAATPVPVRASGMEATNGAPAGWRRGAPAPAGEEQEDLDDE